MRASHRGPGSVPGQLSRGHGDCLAPRFAQRAHQRPHPLAQRRPGHAARRKLVKEVVRLGHEVEALGRTRHDRLQQEPGGERSSRAWECVTQGVLRQGLIHAR